MANVLRYSWQDAVEYGRRWAAPFGPGEGTAEVTVGDLKKIVHENESAYIPIGAVHRLANPGRIPLELIEVQTGSYFGEDDIIRLEDVYKRGS